ncbi:hypothetical protein N7490_003821 [Penicillium lividum]|nr:hypothetical protein N7490_003821 [Penicillium lividum]
MDDKEVDGLDVVWVYKNRVDEKDVGIANLARRTELQQTGLKIVDVLNSPVGVWEAVLFHILCLCGTDCFLVRALLIKAGVKVLCF